MSAKKKSFDVGARVFAKVKGYPAWPARVQSVSGGGASAKYDVFFYGTYESAKLKAQDLFNFDDTTKAKFGKNKSKAFLTALNEIENNPDIKTAEMLMEEAQTTEGLEGAEAAPAPAEGDGALQIDEPPATPLAEPLPATPATPVEKKKGKKGATPAATARGTKRKASGAPEDFSTPPAAKAAKQSGTPSTPASAPTSRSGRVIKPKKFIDESAAGAGEKDDGAQTPKAAVSKDEGGRKMYVSVTATGDVVEINLDKDRPAKFESEEHEVEWDRATAKNALKFKEKVESGEFIPDSVRRKIEEKLHRTPEEEAILQRERQTAVKKDKLRWLKVEQRLVDIDLEIKKSLHFEKPDMSKCLSVLDELDSLQLAPLMLKKQPDVVATVRKLRKYVGPQVGADGGMAEEWAQDARKIRLKADQIHSKLRNAFAVPEGANFWEVFDTKMSEFKTVTKGLNEKQLLTLTKDPTAVLEAAG